MEIILIGGSPLSGKSTYAKKLSKELNCSYICTDDLRSTMQDFASKEKYPDLFYGTLDGNAYDAELFFLKYSVRDIFEKEWKQCICTQDIIISYIRHAQYSYDCLIIEGHALFPTFIKKLYSLFSNIKFSHKVFFLDDVGEIRTRIFKRGLYDNADSYDDKYKEIEVEWVKLFNQRLLEDQRTLEK